MTKNTTKEKAPLVRKAKKGAWWKSLTPDPEPQEITLPPLAPEPVAASGNEKPEEEAIAVTVSERSEVQIGSEESAPAVVAGAERPSEPETQAPAPEMQVSPASSPETATASLSADLRPEQPASEEPPTVTGAEALSPALEQEATASNEPASPLPEPDFGTVPSESSLETTGASEPAKEQSQDAEAAQETPGPAPAKKRRSRRGGKKRAKQTETATVEPASEDEEQPITTELESIVPEDEDNDVVPDEATTEPTKPVVYKLLINAEEPEECRIALVEDGRLESFHVNTVEREATKNNIYKGRIVSIEANLQAAFVDIGTGRNGFLPFNEIHPEYFRQDVSERVRTLIAQQQWKKLKIEEVMQRGQEVLVQVVKEVTGNKGANMTTYLSLPGRFLVLMPGSDSAGISRKIVGEERRASLREIMGEFEIPEGIGYIIRTASADITHNALEKDIQSLLNLWEEIKRRGQTKEAPALIYEEQDTVVRFLRDHFIPEIQEILVDTQESLDNVNAFIETLPSKQRQVKVRQHRGSKPIFNQFNVEEQIESIFKPQVPLPSGGSIVINPTEALVAIDVNSGRTSKNSDFDETIFLANMEAAAELARQLRLRDLGGLIVVDFIDMRNKKHIREVERQVKSSMKRDKAKVDISKISRFGLMQISRQKMGAPIEKGSYRTCEYCQGRGVVRSVETLALYYLRRIQTGITRKKVARVECRLPLDVAQYLLNKKRTELSDLEQKHRAIIDIVPRYEMKPAESQIDFLEADSNR